MHGIVEKRAFFFPTRIWFHDNKVFFEKCEICSIYLEDKIEDVNQRNIFGDTPLHLADLWGDTDAVLMLINSGADVNSIGEREQTPLFHAKTTDIAKILIDTGADVGHRDISALTPVEFMRLVDRFKVANFISKRDR